MNKQTNTLIKAFGVYYVPNKEGKLFAGLKSELWQAFDNQEDAINYCYDCNQGERLDELHIGFRVYPMECIPKGVIVK